MHRPKEKLSTTAYPSNLRRDQNTYARSTLFFSFTRLTMAVHGGLRPEASPAASQAMVRFSLEVGIDMICSKTIRRSRETEEKPECS